MGVKMLNLQVIQWCFRLLGNRFPCVKLQPEPPAPTIKLVKSDGQVKIYDRPVQASELMSEFPKHLVCRSDSLYIGQKIPALSEADQLQLGHIYFLLPKHCFQSVLSFVTIASFANSQIHSRLPKQPFSSSPSSSSLSSSFSRSSPTSYSTDMRRALVKKMTACRQPFHIQKTQSGGMRIRVSDEFISQLMEQGKLWETDEDDESRSGGRVCTNPQLHKDYEQLVGSRLIWKPKLDTIRESTEKRKLNLSSSFGMMTTWSTSVKKPSRGQPSSSSSKGLIIHKHNNNRATSSKKSASASQHHLHLHYSASPKHHLPSYSSKSKSRTKKIKFNIKSRK